MPLDHLGFIAWAREWIAVTEYQEHCLSFCLSATEGLSGVGHMLLLMVKCALAYPLVLLLTHYFLSRLLTSFRNVPGKSSDKKIDEERKDGRVKKEKVKEDTGGQSMDLVSYERSKPNGQRLLNATSEVTRRNPRPRLSLQLLTERDQTLQSQEQDFQFLEMYQALRREHHALDDKHHTFLEQHEALQNLHKAFYDVLQGLYDTHKVLQNKHQALKQKYHAWKQKHHTLKHAHRALERSKQIEKENHLIQVSEDALPYLVRDQQHDNEHQILEDTHHALRQKYCTITEKHRASLKGFFVSMKTHKVFLKEHNALLKDGDVHQHQNIHDWEQFQVLKQQSLDLQKLNVQDHSQNLPILDTRTEERATNSDKAEDEETAEVKEDLENKDDGSVDRPHERCREELLCRGGMDLRDEERLMLSL